MIILPVGPVSECERNHNPSSSWSYKVSRLSSTCSSNPSNMNSWQESQSFRLGEPVKACQIVIDSGVDNCSDVYTFKVSMNDRESSQFFGHSTMY